MPSRTGVTMVSPYLVPDTPNVGLSPKPRLCRQIPARQEHANRHKGDAGALTIGAKIFASHTARAFNDDGFDSSSPFDGHLTLDIHAHGIWAMPAVHEGHSAPLVDDGTLITTYHCGAPRDSLDDRFEKKLADASGRTCHSRNGM